jgi:hypothetical protein
MPKPRVLIVEDEPMVAMDLEATVREITSAEIVVVASVSGARRAMAAPFDFAFLNIEVTDGKTFEIALELQRNEVHSFSSRTLGPKRFHPNFVARRLSLSPSTGVRSSGFCANNQTNTLAKSAAATGHRLGGSWFQ